tara:strand:- start:969 stop:1214 length:246 start_codon:yes stop_codon:yes gene_type:complete
MEMEEYHEDVELKNKQKEELQKLADEMAEEAKKVREDYKNNPSELSGSVTQVHEDSPLLKERHERLITFDGKEMKIKPDAD